MVTREYRTWDDIDINDETLFDDSPGIGDPANVEINGDLYPHEVNEAIFWAKLFKELYGLMVVTGPRGHGKGVFMFMLCWKFKRYFNYKVLLDTKPRRVFGRYLPFTDATISEQVDRMKEVAEGERTEDWDSDAGEVMLRKSVWGMDEFRRRMYKREPHKPVNKLMNSFFNIIRHLQAFVIGATVKINELDYRSCLPHVDYHVKMTKIDERKFLASINKVKWDEVNERFILIWKKSYRVDAAKPRIELGLKPAHLRRGDIVGYKSVIGQYKLLEKDGEKYFQDVDENGEIVFESHYEYFTKEDCVFSWHEDIYYCWFDLFNSENAVGLDVPKSMRPKKEN